MGFCRRVQVERTAAVGPIFHAPIVDCGIGAGVEVLVFLRDEGSDRGDGEGEPCQKGKQLHSLHWRGEKGV